MNKNVFKLEVEGITKEVSVAVSYKRFIFYGGARKSGDNSAFHFASLNVKKDYNNDGEIVRLAVDSAKTIVDKINSQEESSIQSIDFLCHGDMFGLYFIKGASIYSTVSKEDVNDKNLNASLYIGGGTRFWKGSDLNDDSRVLSNIDFTRFTNACKIEIHGCLTAGSAYVQDNFCADLSEYLYEAKKTRSVVIGHTERANPNIKDRVVIEKNTGKKKRIKTTNEEQDYRQGERKVHNNGKEILTINKKGRITGKDIKAVLPKLKTDK